ncbi:MAG: hypothetical protein ACPG4T_10480 [Nannocystaceae bacterium]
MRYLLPLVAVLTTAVVSQTGCKSEKKDLLAYPAGYQPQTAELTFNKANLEAFNTMSGDDRNKHIEELKAAAGTFKGQAVHQSGNGIGETVDEFQYGDYEIQAYTPDGVLFEVTIEYNIYTSKEVAKALHPTRPLEFTGTLIDMRYEDSSKPRKLVVRVKADELKTITK